MSKKIKTAFVCDQCGADYPRWGGQCTSCGEWNTIKEVRLGSAGTERNNRAGYAGSRSEVKLLAEVNLSQAERIRMAFLSLIVCWVAVLLEAVSY